MLIELKKEAAAIDLEAMRSPQGYLVEDEDLIAAANAAIALGKPLLLTGEAGIGKSEFAGWIAAQPNACEMHKFVVKSTTDATDLFYQFDTLARFRDAQIASEQLDAVMTIKKQTQPADKPLAQDSVHRYVRYNALGRAILHSIGRAAAERHGFISPAMGETVYRSFPEQPTRSVVLIDEIDKAPRDVPNDILDEIEHQQFRAPELGNIEVKANPRLRPIVVITSNSERDLPKPFLRRCIYYHMQLTEDDGLLRRIAERRIGKRFEGNGSLLGESLRLFRYLRNEVSLRHRPGLAELLDWLADLSMGELTAGSRLSELVHARRSLKNALLKDPEDQRLADSDWGAWLEQAVEQSKASSAPD